MKKVYWSYVVIMTAVCIVGLFILNRSVEKFKKSMTVVEELAIESVAPAVVAPQPPTVVQSVIPAYVPTPIPTPIPTPGPQFYAPFPPAEPKQAVDAKGKPYKGFLAACREDSVVRVSSRPLR